MFSLQNNNSILFSFIRRNYFLIKFIYTRFRLYNLVKIFRPGIYDSDYDSLDRYFELMHRHLKKFKFKFRNAVVMELGPGNSYIIPYNFLHHGAKKVVLMDKYPRRDNTPHQRAYSRMEHEYFKNKHGADTARFFDVIAGMPRDECVFCLAGDLIYFDFPEKFDMVYSIAVLHHIHDLESSIQKMSSIMRKGGMMFHVVDFKDKWHSMGRPFAFYRYSDRIWNRYLTDASLTYTNRIRYNDYVEIFKKHGFTILWQQTWNFPVDEKKIDRRFARRTDLHIGDAHFLLKKS